MQLLQDEIEADYLFENNVIGVKHKLVITMGNGQNFDFVIGITALRSKKTTRPMREQP